MPNEPQWYRDIIRNVLAIFGHCLECSALDGCYLMDSNRPKLPLHLKCDCRKIDISFSDVKNKAHAECDIEKFTKYIFSDNESSKGKIEIFLNLGYTIDDSEFLRWEFCRQALNQYISGNYLLKNLDARGQRLALPISLNGVNFYSGWMLYPNGEIKNTTPFGGWIK